MAVDRIMMPARLHRRVEMRDDLVTVKIEVDPLLGAASFRAVEEAAVKGAEARSWPRFYVIPVAWGID